jgi:hypothetical protein
MTYDKLMQAHEKATLAYDRTRLGTAAHEKAGKRLDKAAQALDVFRAQQKRLAGGEISVYESLMLPN